MAGINIGALAQGLTSGAQAGLDIAGTYQQVQDTARKQQAGKALGERFRQAAAAGGLGAMDDVWWDEGASLIADTGDFDGAAQFSDLGNTYRARRGQQAAQRAQVLLATGNLEGAMADINAAFGALGAPATLAGVGAGPDGQPAFVTADGQPLDLQKANDILLRLTNSPADMLKLMIDDAKARASINKDNSQAGLAQARTVSEETLLPVRVGEGKANIQQSLAAAGNSSASAQRTRQASAIDLAKAPGEIALAGAQAEGAVLDNTLKRNTLEPKTREAIATADKAETDADVGFLTAPADIATDFSTSAEAAATAKSAGAKAVVDEASIPADIGKRQGDAGQSLNAARDTRANEAQKIIAQAAKDFAERQANSFEDPDELDAYIGFSPELMHVTSSFKNRILAGNPQLSAAEAADEANQMVANFVANLRAMNPEALPDGPTAARAVRVLQTIGENATPQVDPESGLTYIEIDLGDGPMQVFLPPTDGAVPTE